MTKTNPNSTSAGMTHVRIALGNIHVKSTISPKIFLDKWKRLRVQHEHLGHIMKGMADCRKTVVTRGVGGSDGYAHWQVHQSGKQSIHGLKPCMHPDCSTCGLWQRQMKGDIIEMACRENYQKEGESYLVTGTFRHSQNPNCITTLIQASKDVSKWISKYNYEKKTEIAYWGARECTFSANKPTNRRPDIPRYFFHAHIHWVFLFSKEDHNFKDDFFKKLKKHWIKNVIKHKGVILKSNGDPISKHMFDIRSTTPDSFISDYIVKNLAPSMEVTLGNIKEGRSNRYGSKNRSLEELKASIALDGDKNEIKMLQQYFIKMKGSPRFIKSDNRLKVLCDAWKARMKGVHHRSILAGLLPDWCTIQNLNYDDWSEYHIDLFINDLQLLILTDFSEVTSYKDLPMDPYLENAEALGISPNNGTTKVEIRTEKIIQRMKLRDHGFSFWRYLQSQKSNYSSKPSYLDSGRKKPEEYALDPVIYSLKIPKPLFDWLSSTNTMWPILDRIRWHKLCINLSPCLLDTMELLCSGKLVTTGGFSYKTGSLNADFSLRKVKELVICMISQAIYLDNQDNPEIQKMEPLLMLPPPEK